MIHGLFVYGTLAPGKANQHVLADIPGTWEPATVRGWLRQAGWGAAAGYPGIVLDERGEDVPGLVFGSEHLALHWSRLDQFEGKDYARVTTTARLQDGSVIAVWIYALRHHAPGIPG